ncbi:NAD-dependent epimerase/dehydratase family protein [Shewanella baltica]|uniref:NAD-dependent epimerase/dehydratase family protein n=1 Tax=Shewanella baltica TaxID=62322 RepID=UPI00217D8027|nr:NAD-dependent epimerase/dehydratase family protein [Shewanella baltica]MCS6118736.1 NAD-dependent epimerase/dehydratase family protein [Shewanella baltica]
MKPRITVFGAGGFIGSHMASYGEKLGYEVFKPNWQKGVPEQHLGTVIYCNGVGDCNRPLDVMYSHVGLLAEIIKVGNFDKIVYISSTRVYMNSKETNEKSNLLVGTDDKRRLFNIAKLAGEEICLASNKDALILRPSNVYGLALNSPLFLPSLVRDAIRNNEINLYVDKDYAKDYLLIDNLVTACFSLIEQRCSGIFNIASGRNVTAEQIVDMIVRNTDCNVIWHGSSLNEHFYPIDIAKVSDSLSDFCPSELMNELESMIFNFKRFYG